MVSRTRRGVDMTIAAVGITVLVLVVIFLIAGGFQGIHDTFTNILSGENAASEVRAAERSCLQQKQQFCGTQTAQPCNPTCASPGDGWHENSDYRGKTCEEWIDDENAFGGVTLECGQSYTNGTQY